MFHGFFQYSVTQCININIFLQAGAVTKKPVNKYYIEVQHKRDLLQKHLATGLIDLMTFVREIGLVSLKAERKAGKVVLQKESDGVDVQPDDPSAELVRDDSDNDSLR